MMKALHAMYCVLDAVHEGTLVTRRQPDDEIIAHTLLMGRCALLAVGAVPRVEFGLPSRLTGDVFDRIEQAHARGEASTLTVYLAGGYDAFIYAVEKCSMEEVIQRVKEGSITFP